MVPRTAATGTPHPDAIEFVRFCYHRRRVGWPELYDEMCAVAGRGLFRGFSADDLGGIGVGFSLFDMPALATLSSRIVAEEAALRRPMSVVLNPAGPSPAEEEDATGGEGATPTPISAATRPALRAPTPMIAPAAASPTPPAPPARSARTTPDEGSFDVPIRLALVPSGA